MKDTIFNFNYTLHKLAHSLPSQAHIKDFIHHNPLHDFQHKSFFEAIFQASKIFGYRVTLELRDYRSLLDIGRIDTQILEKILTQEKGINNVSSWKQKLMSNSYDESVVASIGRLRNHWKSHANIQLDDHVHPILFRIISNYLDQGISNLHFPYVDEGLINAFRQLEANSAVSFFNLPRAKKLLQDSTVDTEALLKMIVGDPNLYEEYLYDQAFSHHGWSGIVATIESQPETLLYGKKVSLKDFIHLELLLEIDRLDDHLGVNQWKPLNQYAQIVPRDIYQVNVDTELNEVLRLWQLAFEWTYYDQVLAGLYASCKIGKSNKDLQKSFQAVFCIDERECSLRRYVELEDERSETLGCPGFFGVEFYFLPEGNKFYEKLCPAPITPKYLIKESDSEVNLESAMLYSKASHSLFGGTFYGFVMGYWAAIQLFLHLFRPKMNPAINNAFGHMGKDSVLHIESQNPPLQENGLQVGFTVNEMADRVEDLLRNIGMVDDFAPLVYLISHGSSSANNPHHGAYNCGACSGRPGATNARVFAYMANHRDVRKLLSSRGIHLSDSTKFIGAMHDTASDVMGYYDVDKLSEWHSRQHSEAILVFERALDKNAKERSRRFESINTNSDINKIRKKILDRSVSLFEPRPELGHGTNATCIIGRRDFTKSLYLDRRAFLNSYNPLLDADGTILSRVINPLPVVCGGINLEYYFSRMDNQRFGAGTKLPYNIMGLIGVANSSDGDLRPGLPLQMIELHEPIRLLMIIEQKHDVVLKVIKSNDVIYNWFANEWIQLVSFDPYTYESHVLYKGTFIPYQPMYNNVETIDNLHKYVESGTQENLPIKLIKK